MDNEGVFFDGLTGSVFFGNACLEGEGEKRVKVSVSLCGGGG